jgi:hypothetical protein
MRSLGPPWPSSASANGSERAWYAAQWRPTTPRVWEPRGALVEVKGVVGNDARANPNRIKSGVQAAFTAERAPEVIPHIDRTGDNLACSVGMGVDGVDGVDSQRIPDTLVIMRRRFMEAPEGHPRPGAAEVPRRRRIPPTFLKQIHNQVEAGREERPECEPQISPKGSGGADDLVDTAHVARQLAEAEQLAEYAAQREPSDGSCLRPQGAHRAIFRA